MTELIYSGHRFQCFTTEKTGNFLHIHKEVELLYVSKGSMKVSINSCEYNASAGDFVLVFPYTIHKAENADLSTPLEYLLCTFDVDILPFYVRFFSHYYIQDSPVIKREQLSTEAINCVEEIIKRPELQKESNITFGYLTIILEYLLKEFNLKVLNHTKENDWLFHVISYLNENFREKIHLDEMARALNLNKFFISRNFKQTVGCSLEKYTNHLRLDYARNLLDFTEDSIADISFDSGFENISTFYRVFKQEGFGSPQKYRTQRRKI